MRFLLVMGGLGPAIHDFPLMDHEDADGRHKSGHDV